MKMQKKNWVYKKNKEEEIQLLRKQLNITTTTAKILVNRGINQIDKAKIFLNPSLEELHNPFLLKDMDKAVDRINNAQHLKESIWIYGDYDVDGVASVSIMKKYFDSIEYPINYYIPDRMQEGYGINKTAIREIADKGGNLIITVDCGITSVEEVDFANSLGLDVIITDHHECQEPLPKAYAIVNSKQMDCNYPFDMLCGCGIVLKLIQALITKEKFSNDISKYLDIAAVATIADIVPLIDENRIIVKNGLKCLEDTKNIGLKELIKKCGLEGKKLNSSHIAFGLAPRINATGRIGSADMAVKLLTTNDLNEATKLAELLDNENNNRQQIERDILKEALEMIEEDPDYLKEKILVLYNENWHHGVIGIVASRIVEKYYKPTIILGKEKDMAKGSARSIPSFNLFQALNHCKEMLVKFGGHEQAAGLSLYTDDIRGFRDYINKFAEDALTEDDLTPQLHSDGFLSLEEIENKLLEEIQTLEPFGLGNMSPRFISVNLKPIDIKSVGMDGKHLKMQVKEKKQFDSIGFNLGTYFHSVSSNDELAVVFTPEYNTFNGHRKIQLNVKDIKLLKSNSLFQSLFSQEYYKKLNFNHYKNSISNNWTENIYIEVINNKKQYILNTVNRYEKILILVNTLQQANQLLRLTEIREKTMNKSFKIVYNQSPENCEDNEIHIVINPNIDKIQFKIYNNIIVYDMFFREVDYIYYLTQSNKKNTTFLYCPKDEIDNIQILESIIPTRKTLVEIYKLLKKEKDLLNLDINKFVTILEKKLSSHINEKHIQHALDIFQEGGLIDYKFQENKYEINLLNINKKIDIEELKKYQYYNSLYNGFIHLYKQLLSRIKGGNINEFS